MEVTDPASRLTVFFSSSFADPEARLLREGLREHFDVSTPDTLVGSYARHTALSRAIANSDVVVVAVPAAEDPAARNVFVEAGAALGAGRPVLLVGQRSAIPVDLADLPFEGTGVAAAVADEVRLIASGNRDRLPTRWVMPDGPRLPPQMAATWGERLQAPGLAGLAAVGVLEDVFRLAGARVKTSAVVGHRAIEVPDLVVWHDGLTSALGAPLPVEVLLRPWSWPAIRQRLERTLLASGGRTLLALHLGPSVDVPRKWTDGNRTVLFLAAADLVDALVDASLPVALTRLLAWAEP